ncbi:hypothetical protein BGX29_005486 [Mortierella sp. GBA35]|nr:hypothetical protein BGX29_005486 [Mortierella sp. GBA35]
MPGNSAPLQRVQAVRPVFKDGSSTAQPDKDIVQLTCHLDTSSETEFILWEDVRVVFDDALYVRHESRILPFMKDSNYRTLDPFRIAAIPDATLEIVLEGKLVHTAIGAPQAIPQQQQQENVTVDTGIGTGFTQTPISPNNPLPPTQQQNDSLGTGPSNKVSRAPEYLPGDYYDYRLYDHTPLPADGIAFQTYQGNVDEVVDKLGMANLGSTSSQGSQAASEQRGYVSPPGRPQAIVDPVLTTHEQQETIKMAGEQQTQQQYPHTMTVAAATADQCLISPNQGAIDGTSNGQSQQLPKSTNWYFQAAIDGDVQAQNTIGVLFEQGGELRQDYTKAMEWYLHAANLGYAPAQCNVGFLYSQGLGVPTDHTTAIQWYLKAAHQGHAPAQFNIAVMYDEGQGVQQSDFDAMEWYRLAAAQRYASAEYNIGIMYDRGQGVKQDYSKAMEWYLRAASQGHASAQFNVGVLYDEGRGVVQNDAKALEWFLKAAVQGHAPGQFNVGFMYDYGQGVAQPDLARAFEWYHRAAEQGHAKAQFSVGEFYKRGVGGIGGGQGQGGFSALRKALEWYEKAAGQGHLQAWQQVEVVRKVLNVHQSVEETLKKDKPAPKGMSKLKSFWKR